MPLENSKKLNTVGIEELPIDQGESLVQENEINPAELVLKKIESAETQTNELIIGGEKRVDDLEKKIGLPVEDIAIVREESNITWFQHSSATRLVNISFGL